MGELIYSGAYTDVPAVERKISTLRLDLQYGCPSVGCSFCKFYQGHKFSNRPLEEVINTIETSREIYRHTPFGSPRDDQTIYTQIDHLFLGGADTLRYPADDFLKIVTESKARFEDRIHRVAFYATTNSILDVSEDFFSRLKEIIPEVVIYWGIETGNTELLRYVHKRGSKEEVLAAGEKLNKQEVKISANVMIGLGEKRFAAQHVQDTAEVIAKINPRWLNIFPRDYTGTTYEKNVLSDSDNSFLSEEECIQQLADFFGSLAKNTLPEKHIGTIASYSPVGMKMEDMAQNLLFLRGDNCTLEILLNLEKKLNADVRSDYQRTIFSSPDILQSEELIAKELRALQEVLQRRKEYNRKQAESEATYVKWRNRALAVLLPAAAVAGVALCLS